MPSSRSRLSCERVLNSTTRSRHHWLAPSHSCWSANQQRVVVHERCWSPATIRAADRRCRAAAAPERRRPWDRCASSRVPSSQTSVHACASDCRTMRYPPTGFHSPPRYPVTTRAGTPAARIIIAYEDAKWPQKPRLLSNSVVSTESMRGDAGFERVFETVVAEPVEHRARELRIAAGARAQVERQRAGARIAFQRQAWSRAGAPASDSEPIVARRQVRDRVVAQRRW